MSARPEYVAKTRFSAGELALEQEHRWLLARRHNRFAHGWGVVCGLNVVPANDPRRPKAVRVCPGLAISPCGDEIELPASILLDIGEWLWSLKTEAGQTPDAVMVAIRSVGSSATESIRVDALPDFDLRPAPVDLCGGGLLPCPAASTPYVPLARVLLSAAIVTPSEIVDVRLQNQP